MVRYARTSPVYFFEEPLPSNDGEPPRLDVVIDESSGVHVITPRCAAADLPNQEDIVRTLLDKFLQDEEIRRPVLWYYTPMMRRLSAHIDASCVVYDCMDELANFRFAPADLIDRERELFADADVVFTGGASLFERKRTMHDRVYLFPSSVDEHHFRQARLAPANEKRRSNPRFGFHGVIDERLDLELLAGIADARPDWQWTIVGPVVKIDPNALPQRANIEYTGARQYADLPALLSQWDVAIMPFAINEATQFISPTKTPEYFAGGLPVVSTPITDVVSRYGKLQALRIAATPSEFVAACEELLALRRNDTRWLDEIDATLAADSWDRTFEAMRRIVQEVSHSASAPNASGTATDTTHRLRAAHALEKQYDYLIVGAGFAGAVMAERLARGSRKQVLLVDRRDHIGGNAYDEFDEAGIRVHRYGPHIFHTNSDRIFAYLSRFTKWRPYEHRVLASVRKQLVPIPINRTTLNRLFNANLSCSADAEQFLKDRASPIATVRSAEDLILSTVGEELYELLFRCYSQKQWGMDPSELDKAVTARVPTRTDTDDRYFTDKHQCMPLDGYHQMFQNMLDHPNITVMTGVDYASLRNDDVAPHTFFTGPVDEYFGYEFGPLQYRSLEFRRETLNQSRFQPVGVVNYPSADVPYTRITEYTHLTGQVSARTSLSYEFPKATGEPYYPVPTAPNQALYRQYAERAAAEPHVTFLGRLGTYRYYNMDQVVGQALTIYQRLAEDPMTTPLDARLALRAYV